QEFVMYLGCPLGVMLTPRDCNVLGFPNFQNHFLLLAVARCQPHPFGHWYGTSLPAQCDAACAAVGNAFLGNPRPPKQARGTPGGNLRDSVGLLIDSRHSALRTGVRRWRG